MKNSAKFGKLSAKNWKTIIIGLEILQRVTRDGLEMQNETLLSGEDVSIWKKELLGYRYIINDVVSRLYYLARDEYELAKTKESLDLFSQVAQVARDGVILEQMSRQEIVNGVEIDKKYDTAMSPEKATSIIGRYIEQSDRIEYDKLNNYLELGLGVAGIFGLLFNPIQDSKSVISQDSSLISIGTIAISGVKLFRGLIKDDIQTEYIALRQKRRDATDDLIRNEQVSNDAEEKLIDEIKGISEDEKNVNSKMDNDRLLFEGVMNVIAATISSIYINNNITLTDTGKFDGKSLASALVSLRMITSISKSFTRVFEGIQRVRKQQIDYDEIAKQVKMIMKQMEEKVYPLNGASHSFECLKIIDFHGKFYPKRNYETDEIEYATTIDIPEFSIKKGDIVLLSGESGAGKSTFLRLLKRGDINNRDCIEIDDGQKVDNLGNEWISFRPSINLGVERNVLAQITGKESIIDLNDEEKKNLIKIMKQLKLDSPNLLEQLASKNFNEFSTGQQKRLALSKLFYMMDSDKSIIIADEPVGNVENKLIREQLELIVKYAKAKGLMLILTTHRIDLAEDLVTKRYHINNDGVMEQIQILKKQEQDQEQEQEQE